MSPDLLVIVPSRGRPQNAHRLASQTGRYGHAEYVFCVDSDDPTRTEYPQPRVIGEPGRMVAWVNLIAPLTKSPFVGFMGDDHLPVTPGWDQIVCQTLAEMGTGIVYGNDLLQGERLPTAAFMTRDIVEALDCMAPPELEHLYVDNAWKAWGEGMGRLKYLPDVVIEHLHPFAGKAVMDDGYQQVNSAAMYQRDEAAWNRYQEERLASDIAKLKVLI